MRGENKVIERVSSSSILHLSSEPVASNAIEFCWYFKLFAMYYLTYNIQVRK